MIVCDTNVLSELMKPSPNPDVEHWVARQPPASMFVTTITQAEILYGIALLPFGVRRDSLKEAALAMFDTDFSGRVLPFDSSAARAYAVISAARKQAGRPISQFDAQIAGIASSRSAAIATRNTQDFEQCGSPIINPWHV